MEVSAEAEVEQGQPAAAAAVRVRIESAREKLLNKICRDRKWSISFLLTLLGLVMVTFLCERELLRTAWAIGSGSGGSASHIVDAYGDKIKIKTSDAGIFVGIKKRMQIPIPQEKDSLHFLLSRESDPVSVPGPGPGPVDILNESDSDNLVSVGNQKKAESSSGQFNPNPSGRSFMENMATTTTSPTTTTTTTTTEAPKTVEKTYYVFRGIPYAQPPEGPLRWKEPRVVDIKSSAQDNTKYKPVCSQWSREHRKVIGSEDCLYLNIFTPHIPPTLRRPFLPNPYTVQDIFYQQRHLYPVLIHIHGGDLLSGSGNDYSARKLLATQDVILVTFNYRLGIFGFFSSGDESIPGNYGLLDQISAIKWVHKYIQRFGGNPTRVTIFGDVGHLLLSPMAVGLFTGAIWMSADSTNMFSPPGNHSLIQNPRQFYMEVAGDAHCLSDVDDLPEPGSDLAKKREELILDCLRLLPSDKLTNIQASKLKFHSFPRRFVPVKDVGWRDFPVMMDDPEVLMEMGTLIKVPIIAGVNVFEGYSMLLDFTEKLFSGRGGASEDLRNVEKVKGTLGEQLRFVLEGETDAVYDAMFEAIWNFYFGEPQDPGYSKNLTKKLLSLFGDLKSHAGFWKLCKKLTRNSKPPAFAYIFNHETTEFHEYFYQHRQILFPNSQLKSNFTSDSVWQKQLQSNSIPPWQDLHYILSSEKDSSSSGGGGGAGGHGGRGHIHSNEVTLEDALDLSEESKVDRDAMEETMVKIWTSFANYGTPKQAISEFENWTRWHKIEPNKVRFYDLTLHPGSMKTSFRTEEALFWYDTLPEVREAAIQNEQLQLESASYLLWGLLSLVSVLLLLLLVSLVVYCCRGRRRR